MTDRGLDSALDQYLDLVEQPVREAVPIVTEAIVFAHSGTTVDLISFLGGPVPGVPYLASYSPVNGDVVKVLTGPSPFVFGKLA